MASSLNQQCLLRKGHRSHWALFLLIALTVEVPRATAAEVWDYIRVGKDYMAEPKWAVRSGKAQVEIHGDQVEIHIDYTDAADRLGKAAVAIVGTIRSDHTIKASCTFLGTDAAPIQLDGHYSIRHDLQIWGEKRKIITYKEMVFFPSANISFLGFLTKDVRDE
jgi:hypothetical protein